MGRVADALFPRGWRDVPALGEGHDVAARAGAIVVFAVGLWDRPVDTAELRAHAESVIGHQFTDADLLIRSLTHSSVADSRLESNERLEFLGDAILGLVVCEELFHRFDGWLEGDLTKVKSVVVSRQTCAKVSAALQLQEFLILGKGMTTDPTVPVSVLADVFESLLAAVYLDGGYDAARSFIQRTIGPEIELVVAGDLGGNYKSLLQQLVQRERTMTPTYVVLDEKGPDHSKCFKIAAQIGKTRYEGAWGHSKKEAEQRAAHNALSQINDEPVPYPAADS